MKFSKFSALVFAFVFVFAMALTVSAATNDDIIAKLKADGASATQVQQAQDFLKSNSFTAAQLDTVSSNIDSVKAIMDANNVTDPTKLPVSAKSQVKTIVNQAAATVGVTVNFGTNSNGVAQITVTTSNGTYTYSASDSSPKVTGSDNTLVYVIFSAGVVLLAAGAAYVVLSRKKAIAA